MNQYDKKFQNLMKEIESQSQEELFSFMKEKYFQVPLETRYSMEDFFSKFPYWGTLHFEQEDFQEIFHASIMLKENVSLFQDFYQDLEDYRSKIILYAILNNWYCYDFHTLHSIMESIYPHYFDLDILPSCKNEIFVDLGAYIGDTIDEFLAVYGKDSFDRIYAYEMSEESVGILSKKTIDNPNIIVKNQAVSDMVGKGSVSLNLESASANVLQEGEDISVTTLDQDIKERISMIKMDIEGSERKAILGAKKHICEEKPKMMVSVYHGFSDILEIWKLLKEVNSDYKFYLRYYGGPIFPTEIVLYAI